MRQQVVGAYGDQFDFDKVSANLASVSAEFGIEFLSLPRLARNRALDANDLGAPLTAHADVAKISFTGSSATGSWRATSRRLGRSCGGLYCGMRRRR